jgi:hypothetical protein
VVYLVHPIGGGCRQSVQKRDCYRHVLVGPDKSRTSHLVAVDGSGDIPSSSPSGGEVNRYAPLCLKRGLVVV